MNDMRSFDEQMPCVGIFWYDLADHGFFGVRKWDLGHYPIPEATN